MREPKLARATAAGSANVPSVDQSNPIVKKLNRREFLYYVLGASALVLAAESCGGALWFALPQNANSEANGFIKVDLKDIPLQGAAPILYRPGKFWLSYTENGLLALSPRCIREPFYYNRYYKWVSANDRFECPWCGSKFSASGHYIQGPVHRDLDRFVIDVVTPREIRRTPSSGDPVRIDDATYLIINIRKVIQRPLIIM